MIKPGTPASLAGLVAGLVFMAAPGAAQETIRVGIGHQSLCTDTYSGGITVKQLGLLEKHLPRTGKYAGAKYDVVWEDYTSGPPITSQMLAGKLDIGVMGDYPLLVNIARFQETNSLRSVIVSMTGYNVNGSGNSIVVPSDAPIYRFEDLKGKKVSVPFGSAAHGMLLKALVDRGLSQEFFTLINQAPPIGATSVQEKKIDAHADFCPWGELMEFRASGGRSSTAARRRSPTCTVRRPQGLPGEVPGDRRGLSEGGRRGQRVDHQESRGGDHEAGAVDVHPQGGPLPVLRARWLSHARRDHQAEVGRGPQDDASVLQKMGIIKGADVEGFIDDRFVKQAYRELGRDYAREQRPAGDRHLAMRARTRARAPRSRIRVRRPRSGSRASRSSPTRRWRP